MTMLRFSNAPVSQGLPPLVPARQAWPAEILTLPKIFRTNLANPP